MKKSDEFEGEKINESLSDSEKRRIEKDKKKLEADKKIVKKTDEEKKNEEIDRKMKKFIDFSELKKPAIPIVHMIKSKYDLSADDINISYVFLLLKN